MTSGEIRELVELLNAYGEGKLRDDWWPGNAQPVLGEERGARLEALLLKVDLLETLE